MIESSKVVVFFSFFVIKSELGRWDFGGTIYAKPFFFVVDVDVGCIHFRNSIPICRNFLFLLPFHARHSGRTSRRYWSCLIETLILILGFLFARLQYLE